jgi:putative addiction module component (TIGR02574 family)
MHSAKEIIRKAAALPVEERAIVVDSLLLTLNPPDTEIDRAWMELAKRRRADLRSSRVQSVPGDQVFSRIKERF